MNHRVRHTKAKLGEKYIYVKDLRELVDQLSDNTIIRISWTEPSNGVTYQLQPVYAEIDDFGELSISFNMGELG